MDSDQRPGGAGGFFWEALPGPAGAGLAQRRPNVALKHAHCNTHSFMQKYEPLAFSSTQSLITADDLVAEAES